MIAVINECEASHIKSDAALLPREIMGVKWSVPLFLASAFFQADGLLWLGCWAGQAVLAGLAAPPRKWGGTHPRGVCPRTPIGILKTGGAQKNLTIAGGRGGVQTPFAVGEGLGVRHA